MSAAAVGTTEYHRLRPETPDPSVDGSSVSTLPDNYLPPERPPRLHLPTKAPTVRYVPHNGWSRYKSSAQTLLPIRRRQNNADGLPLDSTGLFSYITFSWLMGVVKQMDETNIQACSPLDSCDINGQRLHYIWRDAGVHVGQKRLSLLCVMWRFVCTRVVIAVVIYVVGIAFSIAGSVVCLPKFLVSLRGCTNIVSNNDTDSSDSQRTEAVLWASGLIMTQLMSVLLVAWSWSMTYRTAIRLRSASMALIYDKLVRLSNLNTISTQQMVTLLGTDGQKLYEAVAYGPYIFSSPIVFLLCAACCFFILTPIDIDMLVAVSIFSLTYPLLIVLVQLASRLSARATAMCARRLALVYEMLVHIRLVKMATWEGVLSRNLRGTRIQELAYTSRQYLCDGICMSFLQIVPVVAFILYISSRRAWRSDLKSEQLFPVLALFFGYMKNSLLGFWFGVRKLFEVFPSLERFKSVMLLNEAYMNAERPINRLVAVNISKANFVWENVAPPSKKQKKSKGSPKKRPLSMDMELNELAGDLEPCMQPTLIDINFLAPKGKLIGVCGYSKSGKTSLLLAILGHLHLACGQVMRNGNCAYVGQRPWIWTASVRDNIVFKEPFHNKKYYNAVQSCLLNEDISHLPHNDETQIDEMVLTPGQKQRIALARALYSNRDIYLLDNPLSMVDADMAGKVFEKGILKALLGRTVILATRHVQFLTRCDEVYILEQGKILQSGSHEKLMAECPEYLSLIKTFTYENAKKYFVETNRVHEVSSMENFLEQYIRRADSVDSCEVDGKDPYHLDNVDLESVGAVGAYVAYLGSGCNYLLMVCALVSLLLYNASLLGVPLSVLHSTDNNQNVTSTFWIESGHLTYVNTTLLTLMCVGGLFWGITLTMIVVGVSQRAHDSWFEKLCRAPVGYFKASPAMMCVLNLFSLNIQDIDIRLPLSIRQLLENVTFLLCAVMVLLYVSPYSISVMLVLMFVAIMILGFPHRKCVLKLHEVEMASRGPLYQHLVTTITGRTTIQAFTKDKEFISDFTSKCDDNATCTYLLSAAYRWLAFRVQVIAAMGVGLVGMVLVFSPPVPWLEHHYPDWIGGLALVISMQLGGSVQHILHSIAESEARLKMFAESSRCIQGIKNEEQGNTTKYKQLPANWPTDGSIAFEGVKTLAVPGSFQVLNRMSFDIASGEKIGVVGLPASGKQLVVDALFRLVQITQGMITISGTDIRCVPLDKLRSSIAIVPQEPVLFAGTLRLNIDPHKRYLDKHIWESLQKVNLKERVESLPGRLYAPVDRDGDKLTVGERQLLCLARACLRDIKVLVLEEPLASVGDELQSTLNHVAWDLFPSATILTIAHQMKYVVRCDRVMVVESGKVVEFDSPANLYRNQQSYFSRMISASTGNLFETSL